MVLTFCTRCDKVGPDILDNMLDQTKGILCHLYFRRGSLVHWVDPFSVGSDEKTVCVQKKGISVLEGCGHFGLYRKEFGRWSTLTDDEWAFLQDVNEDNVMFVKDGGYYMVLCPHCGDLFMVEKDQINCTIFRHGYLPNGKPLGPHASAAECEKAVDGCGKPLTFDGKNVKKCKYI